MRYDEVVQRLVDNCEQLPSFTSVSKALVVRTVDGRVRLALETDDEQLRTTLTQRLSTELGPWFLGPVVASGTGPRALQWVAAELLRQAHDAFPAGWAPTVRQPDASRSPTGSRWFARQIVRGKDAFLTGRPSAPAWPMDFGNPRITAFYGFKGGVGRTTTLAILAWHLAHRGDRVVVVDLDLESPGLGHTLEPVHRPGEGLLDYLLTTSIEGEATVPLSRVSLHGIEIGLIPAGPLDDFYVEKLARLDLLHHDGEGEGPVYRALLGLLKQLRRNVDHILLDCRSGLHDLAGLALHDLAHVDVFVGRGDQQELDGMRPLLRGWRARRSLQDRRLLFLRTMRDLPLSEERTSAQRSALYEVLVDEIYDDSPPAVDEAGLAHDPCPVGFQPEISNARWLGDVDVSTLGHATFSALLARLDALWA